MPEKMLANSNTTNIPKAMAEIINYIDAFEYPAKLTHTIIHY